MDIVFEKYVSNHVGSHIVWTLNQFNQVWDLSMRCEEGLWVVSSQPQRNNMPN